VETEPVYVAKWIDIKERNGFPVSWRLLSDPALPFEGDMFDAVISYSAIGRMGDYESVLNEAVRVLRPGGLICMTFGICEPSYGMAFPTRNDTALDMATFDRLVWRRDDLTPLDPAANWNLGDIEQFLEWHRSQDACNNYAVGGAVMQKRGVPRPRVSLPRFRSLHVHQIDTGLGSGNTGDDAMFLAAYGQLPPEFELTTEVHAPERAWTWPHGVRYLSVTDEQAVDRSIHAADLVLVMGNTPIMEAWGLQWPLEANDKKLQLCHHLGKPVHAVGVGVDRLRSPEALRLFQKSYPQIASWSVRSLQCKRALEEMGIASEKIIVGADWAWLLQPKLDSEWAQEYLLGLGARERGVRFGINVVNEMWQAQHQRKTEWSALLDRLIEKYDAQVFFFCNESRVGGFYDKAAAEEVQAGMRHSSFLLADRYYTPDEAISLISRMHITMSERYHFTLFSVLADVYPISIQRGHKMLALNQDLELPFIGDMDRIDREGVEDEVEKTLEDPESRLHLLRLRRMHLEDRAHNNLSLLYRLCDFPDRSKTSIHNP
jgi:polysaccharide pyruvyl transferase WcaK-like protein/SAM-dependent methyltransferase